MNRIMISIFIVTVVCLPSRTPAVWNANLLESGDVVHTGDLEYVNQTAVGDTVSPNVNLAFILDASGSMNARLPGTGYTKLDVAKAVIDTLLPRLPPHIRASLWIYGHRMPQDPKERSCQDIEEVIGLSPLDVSTFRSRISDISAMGYTPISESLAKSAESLPAGYDQRNTILLLSDGEETCGGDPCELADALKSSASSVVIHTVGYAVDETTREQLRCIAAVTGGVYSNATDAGELLDALQYAVETAVSETKLRIEIIDADDGELSIDTWVFREGDASSGDAITGYTSWEDHVIVPGTYDLVIRTFPWIHYPNLSLPEGTTTTIRIPLAHLEILMPDSTNTRYELHDADLSERLGSFDGGVNLAPGTYTVAAGRTMGGRIPLSAGERKTIILGSITVYDPRGNPIRATLCDAHGSYLGTYGGDIALVPGTYRIKVNGSLSEPIAVHNGGSRDIVTGAIRSMFNADEEIGATVFNSDGARIGYYTGDIFVVPGTYSVEINGSVRADIIISSGDYVDLDPGAIIYDHRYEVYDSGGKRLGSFDGRTELFPGRYEVRIDGEMIGDVEIRGGETTGISP